MRRAAAYNCRVWSTRRAETPDSNHTPESNASEDVSDGIGMTAAASPAQ